MHVRACVSRPNGAAGCPPPPSPFHVHSEPTTRPRLQCHCSPPLGCGCRATPQGPKGPRTPVCWLMGKVYLSGLGPEWGNRQPTPEPALDPHRRALPRLPRLSRLSRVAAATAHCPLPTAPSPVLSHSCGILGATRAASPMLRESPQPVTAKGCPR
jgi:hypothetical protein